MNETGRNPPAGDAGEDSLGRLIARAGRRPEPPEAAEAQVRAAVLEEWQRVTDRRRRRSYMIVAAAATAAFVAFGLAVLHQLPEADAPEVIAQVVQLDGDVRLSGDDGSDSRVAQAPGELRLCSRCVLATGPDGGIHLALHGGASVRLAASTHVQWLGPQRARLLAGAVYVDTPPESSAIAAPRREAGAPTTTALPQLTLETDFGRVSHVGTQYVVLLAPAGLTVRVREGIVVVEVEDRAREIAHAAEEMRIDSKGTVTRARIPTYGVDWRWVETLAGEYDVTGRSVLEFLQWVSRETGRPVTFASERLRHEAQTAILHGSTRGMTVSESLRSVMATTRLVASVSNGNLEVTER